MRLQMADGKQGGAIRLTAPRAAHHHRAHVHV